MTTESASKVKRGDATTIALDLGVELGPLAYTSGRLLLKAHGATVITKALTGPFSGTTITTSLTSADTAVKGDYRVEVEMLPGPNTYPSDGYATLRIVEDLG